MARAAVQAPIGARFVAVVHDRSPLAAFVAGDSPLRHPQDLGGRRVASSTAPWFNTEYQSGLRRLGLAPAVLVGPSGPGARPSMVRGEVEAIGSWHEAVTVIRRRAEMPVRAIPFGADIYVTGLVAADTVEPEVVQSTVEAFSDAMEQQRDNRILGLDDMCQRHSSLDPAAVSEEWSVLSTYLGPSRPGLMDTSRWEATLAHASQTHGFSPAPVAEICRGELLREPVAADVAGDR